MNFFIVGGAGFIGSNFSHYLANKYSGGSITIYDNLSSGNRLFIQDLLKTNSTNLIIGDVKDIPLLTESMQSAHADIVFHFASNPDIAKAVKDPTIDFWNGTYLTQCVLEAMRIASVKKIVYASGSGVYGNCGYEEVVETGMNLVPVSTYGASKLAGEALIASYAHMFGIQGIAYRFANVVGAHQTHGVLKDFIKQLYLHPSKLEFLGNGQQSKSYIFIEDICDGIEKIQNHTNIPFDVYNLATQDYLTVKEIADIVTARMGLKNVSYIYLGNEAKGWDGDVGIVRFNTDKARKTGWENRYNSMQAVERAVDLMLDERIWEY